MCAQVTGREALRKIVEKSDLDLAQFSHVVLHPYRLLILKMLAGPPLDFQEIRRSLGDISDGNLASHLRTLEDLGLVQYQKMFNERKVRTVYAITKAGLEQYQRLTEALTRWLDVGRR